MNMMLEQFKTIFDRPEKVKKLREVILDLAVRGKLVEQDLSDEPASVLLERIREEKERLINDGKIKKEKSLVDISEEEKPYELPEGWNYVRLINISTVNGGFAFKSSNFKEEGIRVIRISDFDENGFKNEKIVRHEYTQSLQQYELEEKNILLCMTGGTVGKSYFVEKIPEKMITNQRVATIKIIKPVVEKYVYYVILSSEIQQVITNNKNSTNDNISMDDIRGFIIPIPPLEEQKRIVEKIDSLMLFCDKLEKSLKKKVKYDSLRAKSVFNSIVNVNSMKELEESLRFIISNFKDLTLGDNSVKELKNAILLLAAQGKIVPQNPEDEPASILLERLQEEKERLIKEKKVKKEKPLPEIGEEEKFFELPESWRWIRLKKVIQDIAYGTSKKSDYNIQGVAILRIPNVSDGVLDLEDIKYTNLNESELERLSLEKDDLLIIRSNGSAEIVGKSILIEEDMPNYCYAGYLIRLRIFGDLVFSRYINMVINSKLVRNQIESNLRTTTGVKNINSDEISRLLIPIPPLEEQKRIVKKVDSLMKLCDKLEKKIEKSKRYSEILMKPILKKAFNE